MRHVLYLLASLSLAAVLLSTGCETADRFTAEHPETVSDAQQIAADVGVAAAPATGGLSVIIAALIAAALPTAVAINRWIVARKRAAAIQSIDSNPDTPPAAEQVNTPDLAIVVGKALRATS